MVREGDYNCMCFIREIIVTEQIWIQRKYSSWNYTILKVGVIHYTRAIIIFSITIFYNLRMHSEVSSIDLKTKPIKNINYK